MLVQKRLGWFSEDNQFEFGGETSIGDRASPMKDHKQMMNSPGLSSEK
jgi:hypothetical protein